MANQTFTATCTKATCRYRETYTRHPGVPSCPKCGHVMVVRREN